MKPTSNRWTGVGLQAKQAPRGGVTPGAVEYSEELALEILDHVASGKSLKSFCDDADGARIPGRPSRPAVLKWRANISKFGEMYNEAMRDRAHLLVDEIVHIADTEDDTKKARNMIDARKWAAARYLPNYYGDRLAVTGAADGAPIKVEGSSKPVELSDEQLLAIASKGMTTKI